MVARQNNSTQYADRMEVYLDAKGDGILRTVSSGNVKIITRDCKTGTARRAEYYEPSSGWCWSATRACGRRTTSSPASTITIFLAEDRSVVRAASRSA